MEWMPTCKQYRPCLFCHCTRAKKNKGQRGGQGRGREIYGEMDVLFLEDRGGLVGIDRLCRWGHGVSIESKGLGLGSSITSEIGCSYGAVSFS